MGFEAGIGSDLSEFRGGVRSIVMGQSVKRIGLPMDGVWSWTIPAVNLNQMLLDLFLCMITKQKLTLSPVSVSFS